MTKDSIYRAAYNRRKKLLNTGYQYKENILSGDNREEPTLRIAHRHVSFLRGLRKNECLFLTRVTTNF